MDNNNGKQHSYSHAQIEKSFGRFSHLVLGRLGVGKHEYGDQSFDKPAPHTLDEVQQELLDVNGWSFILWHRLERIKARLGELELHCHVGTKRPAAVAAIEDATGHP